MARQVGDIKITGTIDGLCFYRMEGDYFVRRKSSLTGERFYKDAAFAPSRRSAGLLQRASPLASALYRQLPPEKKGRPVFQSLTGAIRKMLATGQSEMDILAWFARTYIPQQPVMKKATARKALKRAPVLFCLPLRRRGCRKCRLSYRKSATSFVQHHLPLPVLPSAGTG